MEACQNIFDTYRSPTAIQDYSTYQDQTGQLALVHKVIIDTSLLKLRCLLSVKSDTAAAEAFATEAQSWMPLRQLDDGFSN